MAKKKENILSKGIFNVNLVEFFRSGEKKLGGESDCSLIIDRNTLYFFQDTDKDGVPKDLTSIGVKSGKYIIVNGDDVDDGYRARDELQLRHNKEITTSFECAKNAGLDLNSIKVIDITKDLSKSLNSGQKGFGNFEKTVPQGATYKKSKKYDSATQRYTDEIILKSYHRAGCMLIQYKGSNYICGMDEESYFVSKLSNHPKNVNGAFKSLKPRRVSDYEKKSGKQAKRQGEWFFVPVDMEADAMKKGKSLPLQTKGGNKHKVGEYEESNGRHYCKGDVKHDEHNALYLEDVLHEAIQSTALGSWSMKGVD